MARKRVEDTVPALESWDDVNQALATIAADVKHGGMGTFVEILDICLEAAEGGQITGDILASARKYKLMY